LRQSSAASRPSSRADMNLSPLLATQKDMKESLA
jgi:hypothetical protein